MRELAVVEDNRDNRLLLKLFLGDSYLLREYENGADALEGMKRTVPDLILMDISLPGLDGKGVLARVRADEKLRHVPVIAITAHAMVGDREKLLGAGFDGYVSKPIVDEAVLVAAIEGALATSFGRCEGRR